jgi:hypothetical protein
VATRTAITAAGDSGNLTGGKLTIGYGANERSIGLEYAAGLALEQQLDGPILIVKCAWDSRRSMADFWRMPVSAGTESAEELVDEPGWAWTQTLAAIRKVLADPGKYHPDYDPKAGFEPAGLIWFQGSYDKDNPAYAAQLASLLGDVREVVGEPDLPVVCATVGTMYFKGESDAHPVNQGLRAVAALPGFKGSVDVMDSYRWRPSELALLQSMIKKRRIKPDTAMQETLRHAGEGSFYLLAGHEAGSRLAERMTASAAER